MTLRHVAAGLVLTAALAGTTCAAEAPAVARLLEASPEAASVLDKPYIFVASEGRLDIAFDQARRVFNRPNVLKDAERAYTRLLPEGETAEFVIHEKGSNHWYYVNRKSQRSDVKELYRHAPSDDRLDLVFFARGKRFFGEFRSLIHVRATRAKDDKVAYTADVYAYPANAVVRFFVRRLNLVETFFREKTAAMTTLITDIACHLCGEDVAAAADA